MNSRRTPWIQIFGPGENVPGTPAPVLVHVVSRFTIHFVPELTTGTFDSLEIEPSVPLQTLDASGLPALTPSQKRTAIDLVADSPELWPFWTLAEDRNFCQPFLSLQTPIPNLTSRRHPLLSPRRPSPSMST